jgi:hypothetical protein
VLGAWGNVADVGWVGLEKRKRVECGERAGWKGIRLIYILAIVTVLAERS